MTNYKQCNLKLRIANGTTRSIEGCDGISFVFRSGNGLVDVLLTNVAHVPGFSTTYFPCPLSSRTVTLLKGALRISLLDLSQIARPHFR